MSYLWNLDTVTPAGAATPVGLGNGIFAIYTTSCNGNRSGERSSSSSRLVPRSCSANSIPGLLTFRISRYPMA